MAKGRRLTRSVAVLLQCTVGAPFDPRGLYYPKNSQILIADTDPSILSAPRWFAGEVGSLEGRVPDYDMIKTGVDLMKGDSVDVDRRLGYVVFRLSLGINILIHGAGRIFGAGAEAFASKTMSEFANSPLPPGITHAFLTVLPFAEFILGILIAAGLFTRWALTLGGLLMTALIFGTALRSDWATVGIQVIYAIVYYLLTINRADNSLSLDRLVRRNRT